MSRRGLALALCGLAAAAACDATDLGEPPLATAAATLPNPGASGITVMTRNIFLGAEIMSIMQVPPEQVPLAAAQAWQELQATKFHERAELLADEIAAARPHLVGLQEVSLFRVQTPSDFVQGVPGPNATVVAYDFLDILLAALAARGLDYRVVAVAEEHDIEVPAYTGGAPIPFDDIRYSDRDVILARAGVATRNPYARNYAVALPIPLPGEPRLLRGWAAVEATVGVDELLFVTTHLEVQEYPTVQAAQLAELMAWLDGYEGTTVLTGDLNSAGNPSAPERARTATYPTLLAAGFHDTWLRTHDADDGVTCCQAPNLLNDASQLRERLDLVLVRQPRDVLTGGFHTMVVGADPDVRTPSGLWPSDHAGLVAILRLPNALAMR